jgi:hypothetical protein
LQHAAVRHARFRVHLLRARSLAYRTRLHADAHVDRVAATRNATLECRVLHIARHMWHAACHQHVACCALRAARSAPALAVAVAHNSLWHDGDVDSAV